MVVLWAEIFFYSMYDFVRSGAGAGGKQGLRVQKLGEVILSDQSYCPWELPKKLTKIGQPSICHRTIKGFDSSIKSNLLIFQNHRKLIAFQLFPLLGVNDDFEFSKSIKLRGG